MAGRDRPCGLVEAAPIRHVCLIIAHFACAQPGRMAAENPRHLGPVKAVQYDAYSAVGGPGGPTETKSRIEARAVYGHEAMKLAIGCCAGQNGKDRRQHYGAKLLVLALGAARIWDLR